MDKLFLWVCPDSFFSCAEQARAKLSPLESWDATAEQVAAEAEQVREKGQRKCIEIQAKKVRTLIPLLFSFVALS